MRFALNHAVSLSGVELFEKSIESVAAFSLEIATMLPFMDVNSLFS